MARGKRDGATKLIDETSVDLTDEEAATLRMLSTADRKFVVECAMDELYEISKKQALVVHGRYREGKTQKQMAEILDVQVPAISRLEARGRENLIPILRGFLPLVIEKRARATASAVNGSTPSAQPTAAQNDDGRSPEARSP